MRVTVEIDEKLLNEVMDITGVWTQRAAIEIALKEVRKNYKGSNQQFLSMIGTVAQGEIAATAEKTRKS